MQASAGTCLLRAQAREHTLHQQGAHLVLEVHLEAPVQGCVATEDLARVRNAVQQLGQVILVRLVRRPPARHDCKQHTISECCCQTCMQKAASWRLQCLFCASVGAALLASCQAHMLYHSFGAIMHNAGCVLLAASRLGLRGQRLPYWCLSSGTAPPGAVCSAAMGGCCRVRQSVQAAQCGACWRPQVLCCILVCFFKQGSALPCHGLLDTSPATASWKPKDLPVCG